MDSTFRSYRGEAEGYVYFFLDRPDTGERTLVKTDQVALEIYWQAPRTTRQKIVGLRDEKVLPTNIRYHLDHLTVVQDDFGDLIRLGDGDEVAAVLHPLGPGAESHYDYQLSDSLTISYGGGEEVRVYAVRVRPKDFDTPALVGTIYLDRGTAAVVRMSFTFTPASYVDPYLDYIRISLDNALWEGRYWLPYRQEAELRRELPVLDFLAGSIIRGRYEIGNYVFNEPVPPTLLRSGRVTAAPPQERLAFPFRRGLFDDLAAEGLAPTPSLEEIRAQVATVAARRALTGLAPLRLHLRSASHAMRRNRAEGLYLGAGAVWRPRDEVALRGSAGYAFGRRSPTLALELEGGEGRVVPRLQAAWNELRDLGGLPGLPSPSGMVTTLASALGLTEPLDPFFARAATLRLSGRGAAAPALTLRFEDHRSGTDVLEGAGAGRRPVLPVQEGTLGAVEGAFSLAVPSEGETRLYALIGRMGEHAFGALRAASRWTLTGADARTQVVITASAGVTSSHAPPQELPLLGGRETLPGYAFRGFVGRAHALARAEATLPLRPPWVSLRAVAALGWVGGTPAGLPEGWPATGTDGLRPSLGVGVALGWDVLRLDLARGLRDGDWELVFSVTPGLRPWL